MPRVTALLGLLLGASLVFVPPGASGLAAADAATPSPAPTTLFDASELSELSEQSEPSIAVTPDSLTPVTPGDDLTLTVTVSNPTDSEIDPGTVDVYLARRALTTRLAVADWLAGADTTTRGDLIASVPSPTAIPAGVTTTIPVTVPAASIPLTSQNNWGARGIAATFQTSSDKASSDTDTRIEGRGTFVWFLDEEITPVQLAVLMPITTPESAAGLIPATALESYTGEAGLLTRQLDGVFDRPVAIAIDPMIIASIRILGSSAPASATAWLNRLDLATNDIFPLGYADADPAVQSQSGAAAVLAPISFEPLIDPALFVAPAAATPDTALTEPNNTQTPAAASTPSSADLLDWEYTRTDIAWPGIGSVARGDLDFFAANGLTTTILSETNVSRPEIPTPNAVVALPTGSGLVTDDALSDALHTAAIATTDAAWSAAMAEVAARLAVVSAEDPSMARTLVAGFDRGWPQSADRVGQTLEALSGLLWETPATLQAALGAPPAAGVDFDAGARPTSQLAAARSLLERETELTAFSTMLVDPLTITAPARLELLALLSASWGDQTGTWREQVITSLAASALTLQSVTVTTRGPVQVLGSEVPFPITLNNTLSQAVAVRVQVVPSNGRLLVGSDVDTTIDPNSAKAITIPVSAAIGNGDVTLRVTLVTPGGTILGESVPIEVNVRADWEGVGAAIFAGLVVAFFGFGIYRNIIRRRRERIEQEAGGDLPGVSDPPDDTATPPPIPPAAPPASPTRPLTVQPRG